MLKVLTVNNFIVELTTKLHSSPVALFTKLFKLPDVYLTLLLSWLGSKFIGTNGTLVSTPSMSKINRRQQHTTFIIQQLYDIYINIKWLLGPEILSQSTLSGKLK